MTAPHVDVLIVGAGISGIGAACHLERDRPQTSYAVLERRAVIGGTWDLFRYPGIRSDSDMFSFGFDFRPWNDTKILADGESIREYVRATAAEYGVEDKIRFGVEVTRASWSSAQVRWTVETRDVATGESATWTANYLMACTGYYNYEKGFEPTFPGRERFAGTIVHPQHWPDDLDYQGKKVVIIGSGATAVTLVPALAPDVEHVTMLQRSPTYIVSLPSRDKLTGAMAKVLPSGVVYRFARVRSIALQRASYAFARAQPNVFKRFLLKNAERQLGGTSDLANFTPSYDPWDQRLCVVPDGDLFRAVRNGSADVVTDQIRTFTEEGIELVSGEVLEADIIVTATGLNVQLLGGAVLEVDEAPVPVHERVTYKGVLLEGVPNATLVFGYVNASWTLKADLAAEYTCRLLAHMDEHGYSTAVVHAGDEDRGDTSVLGALNSGYVLRGNSQLPRQGTRGPWKVTNNYLRDARTLRYRGIDDGVLQFERTPAAVTTTAKPKPRPRATA